MINEMVEGGTAIVLKFRYLDSVKDFPHTATRNAIMGDLVVLPQHSPGGTTGSLENYSHGRRPWEENRGLQSAMCEC